MHATDDRPTGSLPYAAAHEQAWPASSIFAWSSAKVRRAAWWTLAAASPAVPLVFLGNAPLSVIGLVYLALIALRCEVLSRRAQQDGPILLIGSSGIADTRLGLRLPWQDVSRVWRINTRTARVVDIEVRWPKELLAHADPRVRLGARCQLGSGLPAVSIGLGMLDGSVEDVLAAIRAVRPDLLHRSNRPAPGAEEPIREPAHAHIALTITPRRVRRS